MRKRQPGDGLMYLVRVGGFLALVYSACPQAARELVFCAYGLRMLLKLTSIANKARSLLVGHGLMLSHAQRLLRQDVLARREQHPKRDV